MIDAETESQRIAALSSLTGKLKDLFSSWREEIVKNVALLTTVIDFGEDHDIEEVAHLFQDVDQNIQRLESEIEEYLKRVQGSEVLLKGIKLILVGPPNAGKSSLLNYIANQDAAIVSDIAGTTRDIIDIPIDINGYKVVVGDTAGIRAPSAADTIEKEGIKRAKQKAIGGDVVLIIIPVSEEETVDYNDLLELVESLKRENKELVVVLNKQDLLTQTEETTISELSKKLNLSPEQFKLVSCKTGYGMEELTQQFTNIFKKISLSDSADPIVISERAQDLLKNDVLYGFSQFKIWKENEDVVLASESLRQSVEGIGKITGQAVGVEEILGVVFSSFCIGK
ncbi:hypothetical protein QCA50_016822 [Cerrena zonata]|uniref:TrmE-type G domain-containing protein n=1 Tax=Cerrena zonata TaxID=2478898 RepID=A0AAW0FS26_9APHY